MSNSDFTNSKYPHPDGLSTEVLREILRSDLDIKDEDTDSEYQDYIFRVMEVLELREKSSEEDSLKEIETAWNHFLAENPEVISQNRLAEQNSNKKEIPNNQNQKKIHRLSLSRILISSTLTVLLFATATASAFNFNVFSIIGQWTQDLFHLGKTHEQRVDDGLHEKNFGISNEVQAELIQSGINERVIPNWFPEGFSFTEKNKTVFPDRIVFYIFLTSKNTSTISITITKYVALPDNLLTDYEKSDPKVETYEKEGIIHYILYNYDKLVISWINQNIEISITGDITKKDAHKIIDSVYKEN